MRCKRSVFLSKLSQTKLNTDALKKQLDSLGKRATATQTRGVKYKLDSDYLQIKEEETGDELQFSYIAKIWLVKENARNEDTANTAFDYSVRSLQQSCGKFDWQYLGDSPAVLNRGDNFLSPFVLPEFNGEVNKEYFGGIWERDAHIRLMLDSAKTTAESNGEKRSNILMFGPPSTAKTTIFRQFAKWFNSVDGIERVGTLDSALLSKAGFETYLIELARDKTLPNFLILEEIEKFNQDNLLALLGLMDTRSELTRLNARHGKTHVKLKTTIWATCNDDTQVRNWQHGALWSRFQHRLKCEAPSRDLLDKILHREIKERKGKPEWVQPVMELADKLKVNDARQVIAFLDGRDRLLNGTYQQDIEKTFGD